MWLNPCLDSGPYTVPPKTQGAGKSGDGGKNGLDSWGQTVQEAVGHVVGQVWW